MRSFEFSKFVLLLSLSVMAAACGREYRKEIGREFVPYVERFQEKSQELGKPVEIVDLIVKFGPTEPKQDGVCETSSHSSPTIIINQRAWKEMDDLGRESLMFHELGHCVLNRGHTTETLYQATGDGSSSTPPASLMHPIAISLRIYSEKRDYYIRELFGVQVNPS